MGLGKEKFKTKADTSSSFIIQLRCLFFIDVNALLGVLILICFNLIFFINAISPKGVYDFRPFSAITNFLFSLSEATLLGSDFFFHRKIMHRLILLQKIDCDLFIYQM